MKQGIARKAITAALTGALAFGGVLAPVASAVAEEDAVAAQSVPTPTSDKPKWDRLAGANRYATMGAIVDELTEYGVGNYAILASGENFPDALAASALANGYTPVILTTPSALSADAEAQLARLSVGKLDKVYIVGGEAAVSSAVEASVQALGLTTQRLAGSDRVATSLEVAKEAGVSGRVFIATGEKFADALSIGAYAAKTSTPIILTRADGTLSADAVAYLQETLDAGDMVTILGGTSAVSDQVKAQLGDLYQYERIGGNNRYDTSANIAKWEMANGFSDITSTSGYDPAIPGYLTKNTAWRSVIVATGEKFADALAGAPLAAKNKGDYYAPVYSPILLVNSASDATVKLIEENAAYINDATILGGEAAVSADLAATLKKYTDDAADIVEKTETTYDVKLDATGLLTGYAGLTDVNDGSLAIIDSETDEITDYKQVKAGDTVIIAVWNAGTDETLTVKVNGEDADVDMWRTEKRNPTLEEDDEIPEFQDVYYWFTMPAEEAKVVITSTKIETEDAKDEAEAEKDETKTEETKADETAKA